LSARSSRLLVGTSATLSTIVITKFARTQSLATSAVNLKAE